MQNTTVAYAMRFRRSSIGARTTPAARQLEGILHLTALHGVVYSRTKRLSQGAPYTRQGHPAGADP